MLYLESQYDVTLKKHYLSVYSAEKQHCAKFMILDKNRPKMDEFDAIVFRRSLSVSISSMHSMFTMCYKAYFVVSSSVDSPRNSGDFLALIRSSQLDVSLLDKVTSKSRPYSYSLEQQQEIVELFPELSLVL